MYLSYLESLAESIEVQVKKASSRGILYLRDSETVHVRDNLLSIAEQTVVAVGNEAQSLATLSLSAESAALHMLEQWLDEVITSVKGTDSPPPRFAAVELNAILYTTLRGLDHIAKASKTKKSYRFEPHYGVVLVIYGDEVLIGMPGPIMRREYDILPNAYTEQTAKEEVAGFSPEGKYAHEFVDRDLHVVESN